MASLVGTIVISKTQEAADAEKGLKIRVNKRLSRRCETRFPQRVCQRPVRSPEPQGQSTQRTARCPPWPCSDSLYASIWPGFWVFKKMTHRHVRAVASACWPLALVGNSQPLFPSDSLSPLPAPSAPGATSPSALSTPPRFTTPWTQPFGPVPFEGCPQESGPDDGIIAGLQRGKPSAWPARRRATGRSRTGDTACGQLVQRHRGLRVLVSVARVPCAEMAAPSTVQPQSSEPGWL